MTGDDTATLRRAGPSPLPLHIGLAMAEYSRVQQKPGVTRHDLETMLAGIRKYQNHPYRRSMAPLPCVHRNGQVTLSYCAAAREGDAAVLLIPSLINRSSILDLLPERSLVRWLAGEGIAVYLLDWGEPEGDDALADMDRLVTERLCPAIAAAAAHAGRAVHAAGYCMGGTLLAAAAVLCGGEGLRGLAYLASPWDFKAGDRALADQVTAGTPLALQMMERSGVLPADWIQSVFAAVNADRAAHKFAAFAAMEEGSEAERLFVAVEDWLNDGAGLPRGLAEACIIGWFRHNLPGKGQWEVAGRIIDPAVPALPVLAAASQDDRLVPRESALAIVRDIPGATVLEPGCGHIGMMTGRAARERLWVPLAAWIKACAGA